MRTRCLSDYPNRWERFAVWVNNAILDLATRRLTLEEWEDIKATYPKIANIYQKGIITEKEMARLYREKKCFACK